MQIVPKLPDLILFDHNSAHNASNWSFFYVEVKMTAGTAGNTWKVFSPWDKLQLRKGFFSIPLYEWRDKTIMSGVGFVI